MKFYKEKEIKNPLYTARLDNGVIILVFDGYAEGSDGNLYKCVEKEVREDEFEVIGWRKTEKKVP